MLKDWLAHPLTRDVDLDDPRLISMRREIIRTKPFLRRIYEDWYRQIAAVIPDGTGRILELGSGAGFLRDHLPELITSDVSAAGNIAVVLNGLALPIATGSLKAIVMVDVLHHINEPRRFFQEAARCVRSGGKVVMIEPWVTPWSSVVYRNFHHEPFEPNARNWEFASTGPLSGANGALPWMLFKRDRAQFEREFPVWRVGQIEPQMPFRYLASGGVSMRNLAPSWTYRMCCGLEGMVRPWTSSLAMFARIVLERTA